MDNPRTPKTKEEFAQRYMANQKVVGEDLRAVTHMPCMFCAAPDVILMRALHVREDLERGGKCTECGRAIRVVFTGEDRHKMDYEVFQTEGDDPPDYIMPWPRRVA
jgi:hypothetical protein